MANATNLPNLTPGPLGYNDRHDPSGSAVEPDLPMEDGPVTKAILKDVQHPVPPLKHEPSRIELRYHPQTVDMLPLSVKTATPVEGSPILARAGSNYFAHGNSKIDVWCDGKDTTNREAMSPIEIYRVWRIWEAPLAPGGTSRAGEYSKAGEANQHFSNDGSFGHFWADIPGKDIPVNRADRGNLRHLIEFFVGVANRPDAGGLYFNVVIDETPDQFRVSMHREKRFNAEEWSAWFPTGFSITEVPVGQGAEYRVYVAAPIWRPVALEDDLPVVLSYGGWHKFPT